MQLIVVQGEGYAGSVSVPSGFTVGVQLSSEGCSLEGAWTLLRPIDESERAFLATVGLLPEDALSYAINIPTQEEVLNTLAAINAGSVGAATGTGALNCSRFRPTSPLGGMPNGQAPFFWDGVQGATSYRVNIYNDVGERVTSIEGPGNNTTMTINTTVGAIGGGTNFAWEVEALLNGAVACTTARVNVVRDATAQFVGEGGGAGAGLTPTVCTWQGCS
jgi:hypothetical protein